MTKTSKPPAPKPPKDIKVDVKNPRYEGATIEMVAKAMLQRPKKSGKPSRKDDPKGGSEKPPSNNEES